MIGRYVALKQAGRNHKGLCPFHEEKTPSFNVNADRQIFHCFGCDAGGNAFTFLTRHENLTFPEAVRELGRQVGIEVKDDDPRDSGVYSRLREVNDLAQAFYRSELASPRGEGARRYLEARGLDAEIVERFAIGLAPDRWDALGEALRKRQVPAALAEKAGLVVPRKSEGHYDRLRGRVVFPIRDPRGRILGFGGRALAKDQEPKYLNGPETPIYHKREVFFGLPPWPSSRCAAAVARWWWRATSTWWRCTGRGSSESVATCGTALTEEHARELKRRTRERGAAASTATTRAAARRARPSTSCCPRACGCATRSCLRAATTPTPCSSATAPTRCASSSTPRRRPSKPRSSKRDAPGACATPWERADAVHTVAPLVARDGRSGGARRVRPPAWRCAPGCASRADVDAAIRAA